jgi:hypothetical protein
VRPEVGTIEYRNFSALTGAQRDAARQIYEEAFPAWQRVPWDELARLDTDPARIQKAMLETGSVLGFFVVSKLVAVPWWFLEYFAVVRERRDQGLGGLLWDAFMADLGGPSRPSIVLEVEPPEEEPDPSDERLLRERRITFYERRGALRLHLSEYWVPHLTGEGKDRLEVMVVPAQDETMPNSEDTQQLVRSLYVDGYGLPADDPLIDGAVNAVEGTRWI